MEIFLLIVAAVVTLVIIGKLKGDPDIGNLDVTGLKREIWVTQNWIKNYHSGGCPPKYQEKFQYKQSRLEQANERLNQLISNQTSNSGNTEKIKDEDTPPVVPPEMADDNNYQDFLIVDSIRKLTDLALSKKVIQSPEVARNICEMFKNRIRNVHLSGKSATLDEVKSAIEKELAPVFQYSLDFVYRDMGLTDPEDRALAFSVVAWYEHSKLLEQQQRPLTENQQSKQKMEVLLSNAKRAIDVNDFDNGTLDLTDAARLGSAEAQNLLGEMHYVGHGVARKPLVSLKWWRLAAEQDFANAQYNIGKIYWDGEVVLKDDKEAAKWYRMAAEQGYAVAQLSLGLLYECGAGVPQDNVLALMWMKIADTTTDDKSQKRNNVSILNSVTRKMTANQIAEAQELARKRIANNFKEC
jgi:hypothetical protein